MNVLKNVFTVLILGAVLMLCFSVQGEGANRRSGANVTPGDGLVSHADSTLWHILLGWGFYINNDSVNYDYTVVGDSLMLLTTTQTASGTKTFTSASGVLLGADGQDGKLTIYSEQGETDYSVVFDPHATMTQTTTYTLPANDGDASQFLQTDGSGALVWATPSGSGDITDVWDCANGDCNTLTIGESEYLIGGAVDGSTDPYISLPQGTDVSTVTGEGRISWDTDNDNLYIGSGAAALLFAKMSAVQTEIEDSLNEYSLTADIEALIEDSLNEYSLTTDIQALIEDSLNEYSLTTDIQGLIHDSLIVIDSTYIGADKLSEDDINWRSIRILPSGEISTMEGNVDSLDIFLNQNDILHTYTRFENFSTQAGEICTTKTEYVMTADCDSFIYDIRTETTTADTSGIAIILWKQSKVGGDTTRVYPTSGDPVLAASSTEDTWERKTIAGGSINAISAGDVLILATIAKVNADRYADCEVPSPYAAGK